MIDGAAMASRNVTMIRPNAAGGLNLRRRFAKADNGDIIVGNPEDVVMLQYQNNSGMQLAAQELDRQTREVSQAFLMGAATVRDSERTTAFEVRRMTEELEGTLGGVYSQLNADMQQSRLTRLVLQMKRSGQLPDWPDDMIEPVILTGLEALGREQDITRVQTAFYGLNLPDAVRSEEEVQKIKQQEQQQAAMAQGAQAMAGAAGQGVGQQAAAAMAQQQQQ